MIEENNVDLDNCTWQDAYEFGIVENVHRNEIIVQVDGDDWFAYNRVLANLNNLYYSSDT